MLLVPHLWLCPIDARAYVQRWRPQVVGDQVVSLTGVPSFTRAIVHLADDAATGMLVADPDSVDGPCAFVLHDRTVVASLWTQEPSAQAFRSMRVWYRATTGAEVTARLGEDERRLWQMNYM